MALAVEASPPKAPRLAAIRPILRDRCSLKVVMLILIYEFSLKALPVVPLILNCVFSNRKKLVEFLFIYTIS